MAAGNWGLRLKEIWGHLCSNHRWSFGGGQGHPGRLSRELQELVTEHLGKGLCFRRQREREGEIIEGVWSCAKSESITQRMRNQEQRELQAISSWERNQRALGSGVRGQRQWAQDFFLGNSAVRWGTDGLAVYMESTTEKELKKAWSGKRITTEIIAWYVCPVEEIQIKPKKHFSKS